MNKVAKISITAGFAMFSMFFGSGNLVFPIKLGIESSLNTWPSMFGLILTGVIVPFVGLYGIMKYKGYAGPYFNYIGKNASQLLIFLMLALLGPFGVIPRCITVATSGMLLVLPEIPQYIFSLFFALTVYYMLATKVGLVQVLGKFLSPLLLIGLIIIILAGIFDCPSIGEKIIPKTDYESFSSGILTGYHTMDLMAAFFFGVSIAVYIKNKEEHHKFDKRQIRLIAIWSSIIGGVLLSIVYFGFVYLGAKYSFDLAEIPAERLIVHVADITLGGVARPLAAVTIFMACFTTAVVLTQIFCDYIKQNISSKKNNFALQGTVLISYAISLCGFEAISVYLSKILGVLYPGIITIAVANLVTKHHTNRKKYIFWAVILLNLVLIFTP